MTDRELTPVFDGAKDLPVRKGWYPTAPKCDRDEWARRYWNGHRFSVPCFPDDSDGLAEICTKTTSLYQNSELYWCGLTAPYKP